MTTNHADTNGPSDSQEGSDAPGLPNLVIIGAMKSGTTSLHQYLDQHPAIAMSRVKEINFFLEGHWDQGVPWYRTQFDASATVRGEASTSYTKFPQRPGVPARMYSVIPGARLIYVVRDPIDRAISHYLHAYQRSRETRSIVEALRELEDNTYVDPSRYHMQLEQYLPYYPLDRILVLSSEDLRDDPAEVLQRITRFLEVTSHAFDVGGRANVSERRGRNNRIGRLAESYPAKRIGRRLPKPAVDFVKSLNARMATRVRRPELDARTREALIDYLRDDVQRLRSLTGLRFEQWSL